ncbi:integrin alpha [Undibacterium sp. Jales W-56]|uniref:integrin alpha n=1 Tax=Undibacterium sp. Jales W-56 TaxID=2897325 RepID=UPI0021CE6D61|nr:integrin alpha [Undibacterium sp. Jales W-56]MCU6432386.1 integrin alpha [Undibacterium sp. Jales W-56]
MKTIKQLLILLITLLPAALNHAADKEVGVLLRSGEWRQGVGSYGVPKRFEQLLPSKWPKDQWYSLMINGNTLQIQASSAKEKNLDWLKEIIRQIPDKNGVSEADAAEQQKQETDSIMYLRVPGSNIKEGKHPLYMFKNGSNILNPELDYQYRLSLNGVPFGMRVQNGLKGKNGAPYGEGATYFIEYDGKQFEYALGYFGWASRVVGISDIDGDGFPDFIIEIDGSNSGGAMILLSSTAKPGKNAPTASLHSWGC